MAIPGHWQGATSMPSQQWTCGFCGHLVASKIGYFRSQTDSIQGDPTKVNASYQRIFICSGCDRPTYFEGVIQVPGVAFGKPFTRLPPDLNTIYDEARNCMAVNSFISAVLTARTILMHIAVDKGAPIDGVTFQGYVDFIVQSGFSPPNSQLWIDHVRKKGNDATHRMAMISRDDAEKVLRFVEMVLMYDYEIPAMVQ